MAKVKVVHCLGALNTGGVETLVMNVFRKIDREKFHFDFLLFNQNQGFYDQEARNLGAELFYCPSLSKVGIYQYLKQMISFFKAHEIDVVHSHMDWQGGFIAYAAHKAGIKKIIVHSHANQKMFDANPIYHILISLNKYLISKYETTCLACSQEAGESLFKGNFQVLFNGIDFEKFQHPDMEIVRQLKEEFDIQDDEIVLGHVGGFSDNKNQGFLINVFKKIHQQNQNYKLILVGDGSTKSKLEQEVKDLGLEKKIIFTGVRKEIPELMHVFDIFLFPSKYEGLGIVAIEAQASGLPCIISDGVPKSVDIGYQSIKWLGLDQTTWVNTIFQTENKKTEINEAYSNYSINSTIEVLNEVYTERKTDGCHGI